MKQILILLLLISSFTYSQKKPLKKKPLKEIPDLKFKEDTTKVTYLDEKDFGIDSGKMYCNRKEIKVKDASEKLILTKFLFSSNEEKLKLIGLQKLNVIIHTANYSTMLKMKNKYTYIPRKISLFYSEENKQWTCAIEYTSQNDYGAIKDGTYFHTYTESGEKIDAVGGF